MAWIQAGLGRSSRIEARKGARAISPANTPYVMPGLVPGIHVPPPARPLPAHTAMPQDVDARNKSGHDDVGRSGTGRKSKPDSNGLVPGISCSQIPRTPIRHVDGRDKPGHDELGVLFQCSELQDQDTRMVRHPARRPAHLMAAPRIAPGAGPRIGSGGKPGLPLPRGGDGDGAPCPLPPFPRKRESRDGPALAATSVDGATGTGRRAGGAGVVSPLPASAADRAIARTVMAFDPPGSSRHARPATDPDSTGRTADSGGASSGKHRTASCRRRNAVSAIPGTRPGSCVWPCRAPSSCGSPSRAPLTAARPRTPPHRRRCRRRRRPPRAAGRGSCLPGSRPAPRSPP